MIRKLNNFFFILEENENIGSDGLLFYCATAGTSLLTLLLLLAT